MRISNGHWYCDLCGARIDGVPLSKIPHDDRTLLPGGRARGVLRVNGRVVHSCEVTTAARQPREPSL